MMMALQLTASNAHQDIIQRRIHPARNAYTVHLENSRINTARQVVWTVGHQHTQRTVVPRRVQIFPPDHMHMKANLIPDGTILQSVNLVRTVQVAMVDAYHAPRVLSMTALVVKALMHVSSVLLEQCRTLQRAPFVKHVTV